MPLPPTETRSVSYEIYRWKADDPQPARPIASGFARSQFTAGEVLETGTSYRWRVVMSHKDCRSPGPVWTFTTMGSGTRFRRGDADTNGTVNITDAVLAVLQTRAGKPAGAAPTGAVTPKPPAKP